MADTKQPSKEQPRKARLTARTLGLLLLPLVLLGAMILVFLNTNAGLDFEVPAPIENLDVQRVILTRNHIEIVLRNTGPEPITIAQMAINDGVRLFTMDPDYTIPRLGTATLSTDYGWVEGEAYAIRLFTTNAIAFDIEIPVAFETPAPSPGNFLGFFLIGLYVGVIPVFLGVMWLPALRRLHRKWMTFLLAVTIGLLIFLGIDTLVEALEQAAAVPGPFQGVGLVAIGAVGVFLLLRGLSLQEGSVQRDEAARRLSVAYLIALGIGLHNLGEGLAIGAAYNVGEIALGTFLVVGFIIQNITEGLGIIAPVLRDRTRVRDLIYLGLLGGAPAILGAWLGGFSPSPTLAVLFLGIGTGAIFEVAYEISLMLQGDKEAKRAPYAVFAGVFSGMLLLWVTGLIIK
jgi:ZIP family zinc transporter